MRRFSVVIALMVWTALALPTAMAAELPRTVSEQAEWLADFYMAGLDYHYGRYGLMQDKSQGAGRNLAHGLSEILEQPLDARQLSEISGWLFRASASIGALDISPPPLALKDHVGTLLDIVGLYVSRPRLSREQQDQIAGQLGVVLDQFRQAMLEEFGGVPDGERFVRDAVYARAAECGRLIKDPVVPLIKRAYTPEEIESLCASARELPAGQHEEYLSIAAMTDPDGPRAEEWRADAAKWTIHGVGWLLRNKIMAAQYTPPVILTPDEQASLLEYYRNTQGALEDAPEAMRQRAEEVRW